MAVIGNAVLVDWSRDTGDDGHRDYMAKFKVETSQEDGPYVAGTATGLPVAGAHWAYGADSDPWAFLLPKESIRYTQKVPDHPHRIWYVTKYFSTKPINRCQDASITDPLLLPAKWSGTWRTIRKEAMFDKDANPVMNSAKQLTRGSVVERDYAYPTIRVKFNVTPLPLALFDAMLNRLNDATLWGLPKRCVRLSSITWEQAWYGTCSTYFSIEYVFEVNGETFDVPVLDEGTMELKEGGDPNKIEDFVMAKDPVTGENTKVLLDGGGKRLVGVAAPVIYTPKLYKEGNLLTLGIPATLGS